MPSEGLDAVQIALAVGRALDTVGAGYFVGGSLASSLQGEPRSTNDIDVVVNLNEKQARQLSAALGSDFDVDEEALCDAVRRRTSWNIYHLPTMLKIDLFMLRDEPFDQSEFSRSRRLELAPGEGLTVKSPEDTVLRKLLWFVQGGSLSTTQWRDIVEVLRVSGPTMDALYMARWAATLGVSELLAKARTDATS
jgi:hypothetical protein